MATSSQKSDHVSEVRQTVTKLLEAQNQLAALRREWDALGLSSELVEEDMVGENAGLTPADIAAVYTTLGEIETLMAAGHATNLYKVKL